MLKSYLLVALRSVRRHKAYASITVFGLALGIACCGLIGLYVVDELSYDRHHADADHIFRVVRAWEEGVNGEPPLVMATTSPPIVPLLREQFPQVRDGFRLATYGEAPVRHGEEGFREERLYYAEPAVFEVFTLPLLEEAVPAVGFFYNPDPMWQLFVRLGGAIRRRSGGWRGSPTASNSGGPLPARCRSRAPRCPSHGELPRHACRRGRPGPEPPP